MPQSLPQRWARLIGGQGRPSARPPSPAAVAERVRRYPERAAQALADQARRQDRADPQDWLAQELEQAAELLDAATRARIAELAESELSRRLPKEANHDD